VRIFKRIHAKHFYVIWYYLGRQIHKQLTVRSMRLRFTKMQGLGNDFVVIDAISQRVNINPNTARQLADRRFGVGCDQLLVVMQPQEPDSDFRYRIFNSDGTEVEMCGNGARCFAKFVSDQKLTGKSALTVETLAGKIRLLIRDNGDITVDMGIPILEPVAIPMLAKERALTYALPLADQTLTISAVSMGNPHAVAIVDNVTDAPVAKFGLEIEAHSMFPQRVNAGFMTVVSRNEINLRVFERGAGETLACGSGACAAVVVGRLHNFLDSTVTVNLPGGSLIIKWLGEGHPVMMTGPAATVFMGQIDIKH
jgi:diaminopimelate epimerase